MVRPRIKIIPKNVLYKEYWHNFLSIRKIAKLYKVSPDTVNRLLAEYDIPVRNKWFSPTPSKRKRR